MYLYQWGAVSATLVRGACPAKNEEIESLKCTVLNDNASFILKLQ